MEGLKNIIVLKNLPSNLIEEAFVVVKPNVKIDNLDEKVNNFKKNYVVSEAENVIINYINKVKDSKEKNKFKNIENKYKKLKVLTVWLALIVIIGAIANFI